MAYTYDNFKGDLDHPHLGSDLTNDSTVTGTTITDALDNLALSAGAPDIWKDNVYDIRALTGLQHETGDDIGYSGDGTVYQYNSAAAGIEVDATNILPYDIGLEIEVTNSNTDTTVTINDGTGSQNVTVNADAFANQKTRQVIAAELALALDAATGGNWIDTHVVGTGIIMISSSNASQPALRSIADFVNTTVTYDNGRWVKKFVLVDTILAQTLSNKTIDNTNVIISTGSNGLVKLTAGVPSVINLDIPLGITINGQGNIIPAGQYGGYSKIPYACVITGWVIYEGSGAAVSNTTMDVWIDNTAAFPPTVADTIFATKPALVAATNGTASGGTIFVGGIATFAVTAGAIIAYNVDSNTAGVIYTLQLLGYKI